MVFVCGFVLTQSSGLCQSMNGYYLAGCICLLPLCVSLLVLLSGSLFSFVSDLFLHLQCSVISLVLGTLQCYFILLILPTYLITDNLCRFPLWGL